MRDGAASAGTTLVFIAGNYEGVGRHWKLANSIRTHRPAPAVTAGGSAQHLVDGGGPQANGTISRG